MNFDRFKKYVNRFLLLVFFVFTVSDLIEMHLRVIFKIEIHQDHYFLNKVGKTKQHKEKVGNFKNLKTFGFWFLHAIVSPIKNPVSCKFHFVNGSLNLIRFLFEIPNLTLRAPPSFR